MTEFCQKLVEDGQAVCGVKLDCHVHDWRQREDVKRALDEYKALLEKRIDEYFAGRLRMPRPVIKKEVFKRYFFGEGLE